LMENLIWLLIIGTSIWMAFDASKIGYDKKDVKGIAGMGPAGWLFAGLLLWIITFPLYLASRNKLKEAAARKMGNQRVDGTQGGSAGTVPSDNPDPLVAIKKLGELMEAGMITEQEYENKKAKLLDRV
jgi:hypothetical protein